MKAIGDTMAVLVGENYVNRFGMDGRRMSHSARSRTTSPQPGAIPRQDASGAQVAVSNLVTVSMGGTHLLDPVQQSNVVNRPYRCVIVVTAPVGTGASAARRVTRSS